MQKPYRNDYLNQKYARFTIFDVIKTYGKGSRTEKHIEAVWNLLKYAIKGGYLDEDDAKQMSWADMERYYNQCQDADMKTEEA